MPAGGKGPAVPGGASPIPSALLRTTNVLGFMGCIAVNVVSSIGLLGKTNAEISTRWPTPLTPDGWAFSIWGIIFLLQACGVVYQALPRGYAEGSAKSDAVLAIGYFWQIGWACQSTWQLAFLLESRLGMCICAAALMGALASFGSAMLRLRSVMHRHKDQERAQPTPGSKKLLAIVAFLQLPTSINAAWLTVATGLGLLIVPAAFDVPAHLIQYGAAGVAAVVVLVGVSWLLYAGDAGFGATLLWAAVALSPKYRSDPWLNYVQMAVMGVLAALIALSFVPRPLPPRLHAPKPAGAGAAGEERRPLLLHARPDTRVSQDGEVQPAAQAPDGGPALQGL